MGDYCVYKHTSPSGKVYIGVTKQRPEKRWCNGIGYKQNKYFFKAICKYGWRNFQHEIIVSGLSYEDAANMEISLISSHNAVDKDFGYNIEHGGNMCGTHSEETKRKISIANMRTKSSPEARAAMALRSTGKKHSERTKLLIGEKSKAKPMTESWRQHLKDCNKKKSRAVEQIDLNGNVVARFSSQTEAAKSVNGFAQNIWRACNGIKPTCRGYGWRYCDEDCC